MDNVTLDEVYRLAQKIDRRLATLNGTVREHSEFISAQRAANDRYVTDKQLADAYTAIANTRWAMVGGAALIVLLQMVGGGITGLLTYLLR